QMAAGLAHEIRNPLAGMEIVTGLLKRRLADREEECSLVTQLQSEVRSLARTVEDCLEFVRPISPERGPVDPEDLVNESLDTALKRCSQTAVRLHELGRVPYWSDTGRPLTLEWYS
ncbi:MAG: hypothetical protein IH921_15390, partial [Gemmatimonadetes bacterium]|nr:hypothetical protein [Gemmatimonadota bacterium]